MYTLSLQLRLGTIPKCMSSTRLDSTILTISMTMRKLILKQISSHSLVNILISLEREEFKINIQLSHITSSWSDITKFIQGLYLSLLLTLRLLLRVFILFLITRSWRIWQPSLRLSTTDSLKWANNFQTMIEMFQSICCIYSTIHKLVKTKEKKLNWRTIHSPKSRRIWLIN